MRTIPAFVITALLAGVAIGQTARPPGFVRGVVTANTSAAFTVRTSAGALYQYRADSKTWIERDRERIRASGLQLGELLEVVSDRDPDPVRYARVVHVIEPVRPRPLPVSTGGVYRLNPAPPSDTGVYAGLIVARDHDRITLRTRFDGDKTIYLHPDTQCLEDGDLVESSALVPLTRVYVVVSRDAGQEWVANQVIWGVILEPRP